VAVWIALVQKKREIDVRRTWLLVGILASVLGSQVRAEDGETHRQSNVKVNAWAWLIQGQIVHSGMVRDWRNTESNTFDLNHAWVSHMHLGIRAKKDVTPKTQVVVHPAFWLHGPSTYNASNQKAVKDWKLAMSPYLIEATMSTEVLKNGPMSLNLKAGYFNYKFNPETRNLGEYPIRSVTNPLFLYNGFEYADKHKELGALSSMVLGDNVFGWDVLFTSETSVYPLYDFSIANAVRYKPIGLIDFGAAIMFDRLIPVDEKKTTPGLEPTRLTSTEKDFYIGLDPVGFEREEIYRKTKNPLQVDSVWDTTIVKRTVYDTTYYSFAGTKVGVRITIDPKWFWGTEFFSPTDLKIYAEAGIIGLEHYKELYKNMFERMPIMGGVNVPTHPLVAAGVLGGIQVTGLLDDLGALNFMDGEIEIPASRTAAVGLPLLGIGTFFLEQFLQKKFRLDILNIEVEYLSSPYANSLDYVWSNASPIPQRSENRTSGEDFVRHYEYTRADDWKWSLYMCKKVADHLRFSAQVANDRTPRSNFGAGSTPFDVTIQPDDWYFMGLMEIMF